MEALSSGKVEKPLSGGQFLGLINELETATFLLVEGLISLASLSGANDFAHMPLQLLGQGLERLLKVELVVQQVEESGSVPAGKTVKTHNLVVLLDQLLACDRLAGYGVARIAAKEDVEFLETDAFFRKLLGVMSDFGSGGRYFDLDSVLDPLSSEGRSNPVDDFQRIEMEVLQAHPEWEAELGAATFSGFYAVLYGDLCEVIQRGIRALARLLAWDFLGPLGKQLSGTMIATFLTVRDAQLRNPPGRWFEKSPAS